MTRALSRRAFIGGSSLLFLPACERKPPETPLAHLYGKEWVHGAYSYYAKAYVDVEGAAQRSSFRAYELLAQKGVSALAALQSREVPFYIRVASDGGSFRVAREVPERLTFTADMSQTDRQAATEAWKRAREQIQTDYEEVERLNWALDELLSQVSRVRYAIDQGQLEEFRLCRQLDTLAGGGELPFPLPYEVSRADYQSVLWLLLERIESDRERLRHSEAAIVAVGLSARATDAGSASLAPNLRQVLLAVAKDAEANLAPPTDYPASADERHKLFSSSQKLHDRVVASQEYKQWLAAQLEAEDSIGKLLAVLDSMTGLPTSSIYRQVMRMWRGQNDYFDYLKLAVAIVPGGSNLAGSLNHAVDVTGRYRAVVQRAGGAEAFAKSALDREKDGRLEVEGAGLVNVATRSARRRLDKQLVYFESAQESDHAAEELAATLIGKAPLPEVPKSNRAPQ
jgi:hypothetical protein